MKKDTTDRQDRDHQLTTHTAADGPVVGFELSLSRNEPAECTLYVVESAELDDDACVDMWIAAKEGSFVDLEASR